MSFASVEQIEAHAAQGYSLPDVARLLGVPFFSDKDQSGRDAVDAFNRGAERWRQNGQPRPPRANDIIAQAVHSQLLSREMTRPKLKEVLGFRYDDLNLAIETLEGQLLIDHEEDAGGTVYYRGAGIPSQVAPRRSVVTVANGNGHEYICVDCKGPRSYGSGQRCKRCYDARAAQKKIDQIVARGQKSPETTSNGDSVIHESKQPRNFETFDRARPSKFGISVTAEVRKIVEAMDVGWETDTPRLFTALLEAHPALKNHNDIAGLRTYISQGVFPLKGKLLRVVSKGKAGSPDILCRIPETAAPKIEKNITETITTERTKVRTEIAQPIVAETVEQDKEVDTLLVKFTPQQMIDRFNGFDDGEIDEFFSKMNETAGVDNVVWGVLPEEPKHSKQFFSVAYNVLVTMLDDSMTGDQKQSVWTLICYLKRLQKDGFRG